MLFIRSLFVLVVTTYLVAGQHGKLVVLASDLTQLCIELVNDLSVAGLLLRHRSVVIYEHAQI